MIEIPSYIGKEIRRESTRNILDITGKSIAKVHNVNDWDLSHAVQQAIKAQEGLKNIPRHTIGEVLSQTADSFMTEKDYETIVRITGSPYAFVSEGIEFVKYWARDSDRWASKILNERNVRYEPSTPTVVILPGNSEQEFLYVATQVLMSRNAAMIRPSSKGAGSYVAHKFMNSYMNVLNGIDEQTRSVLLRAVSIINTQSSKSVDDLLIDDFNYIAFGNDNTIREFSKNINKVCTPRSISGFGTGFSMSIVNDGEELVSIAKDLMSSITTNRGNECNSTDIIYISDAIYLPLLGILKEFASTYRSGNPFDSNTIGILEPNNASFIKGELKKRNLTEHLNTEHIRLGDVLDERFGEFNPDQRVDLIHPSIIPLTKFDNAIEYPGPIASVRSYSTISDLAQQIRRDLRYNGMKKNLVTAVYTDSEPILDAISSQLSTHAIKHNIPTHSFNLDLPHQGIYLIRDLSEKVYVDRK